MWKRILVVLILLGALGAGLFFWVTNLTNEPVKVIQSQLDAINGNDISTAYGYFASPVRSSMSLEQYRAIVEKYSTVLKSQQANFPYRQLYWRGGTFVFERGSQPRLTEAFLTNNLHANQNLNNVALIRGTLVAPGGKSTKVRYLLMEEADPSTGKDHWVIYDFSLGKW
jgi:hypothetical protein